VSSVGLVLTLPIVLVAALAIRLDSPGPVICRHPRVGRSGAVFEMFTLRCTVVDTDGTQPGHDAIDDRAVPSSVGAARLTRVGRILRWSSIDELPVLWNVLRGEMSLVGPRPTPPSDAGHGTPDSEARRTRPGLTGTWQESDSSKAS
jgi:lipopolysaccharide/colanic/teichoic acid biosynthesis glycosyltransferase